MFLDATNAFGSVEPSIMKQAIQMCNMNKAYRDVWLDLNSEDKLHVESGKFISKQLEIERVVCQGGLSSLLTYNVSTDTLPKWIESTDEGYEIGNAKVPDLVCVDDQSLVTVSVEAMQRLLDIVTAWSRWTTIEFNALKCWYFYEIYQGNRAIHPDIELTLIGIQIKKADPEVTVWHLGIQVQLN